MDNPRSQSLWRKASAAVPRHNGRSPDGRACTAWSAVSLKKAKREAAAQRHPAKLRGNTAVFVRNDRVYGWKRNALQTQKGSMNSRAGQQHSAPGPHPHPGHLTDGAPPWKRHRPMRPLLREPPVVQDPVQGHKGMSPLLQGPHAARLPWALRRISEGGERRTLSVPECLAMNICPKTPERPGRRALSYSR